MQNTSIPVLTVLCTVVLSWSAVADFRTLWPVPKSGNTKLSDIVGAYQYKMDGNALYSVSVVTATSSSSIGGEGDDTVITGGNAVYGWKDVSGEWAIPSVARGWDKDGAGNDIFLEIPIKEVAPSNNGSGSNLAKLTSVTVSEGIETLSGAFSGANGLKSVCLPSTLKTIGAGSFRNCSALMSIDIPDSVETIGTQAFLGCSALKHVKFPASLTSVGERAFQDSGVVAIDLPQGCAEIGQYAFSGCGNLSDVEFGGCMGIGDYAFQNCNSLTQVDLPSSVQSIGNSAFVGCSALSRIGFSKGLLSIGGSAFSRCSLLVDVILPDGLASIGANAFQYCTGILRLSIPSSVSSVGSSAFYNCAPKDLTEGAMWTMTYSSVTNFTLLPGLATFGNKFKNSTALEKVSLPDSVTKIEAEAFSGCTNLSVAAIPDSVEIVGNSAFYNCKSLSALPLLGGSVTNWGSSVFRYCTGVAKLSVPGNMKAIPGYMFANCSNLVDVVVEEGVETIAQTAFLYDDLIHRLSLPSTATNLSYANYAKTDYAKNLETATFHQLHPPKNVAKAFLRNFTGVAYYPPDYADEWEDALKGDGLAKYGKPWTEALESEPGAVDVNGIGIPYGWLAKYGLISHVSPSVAARTGTGKVDAHGKPMKVWQDYVAGTDPTDATSQFTAMISITNGVLYVSWSPNLNTNGVVRKYTVLGRENLTDDVEWAPTNSTHRFFTVRVDMP